MLQQYCVPLPSSSIIIRLSRVAVWSITADSNCKIKIIRKKNRWLKRIKKSLKATWEMRRSDEKQETALNFRHSQNIQTQFNVPSQPWTWTLPSAQHHRPRLWPGCNLSQRGWRCRRAQSSLPAPARWCSPPRGCTYSCHPRIKHTERI